MAATEETGVVYTNISVEAEEICEWAWKKVIKASPPSRAADVLQIRFLNPMVSSGSGYEDKHQPKRRQYLSMSTPGAVSIGPYWRQRVLPITDEFKWKIVRYWFFDSERQGEEELPLPSSPPSRFLECIREIAKEVPEKSKKYGHVDMGPREFAEMLLLDGCFIVLILFILWPGCPNHGIINEAGRNMFLEISPYLGQILKDLQMLGNQIPFSVLRAVWSSSPSTFKAPAEKKLVDIVFDRWSALETWPSPPRTNSTAPINTDEHEIVHLLHVFHIQLFPSDFKYGYMSPDQLSKAWILERHDVGMIPSAEELHDVGIKFVKKKNPRHLMDIEFVNGVLRIPPLYIDDDIRIAFHNLVEFEQQAAGRILPNITTYAKFMVCLVRGVEDVRLLGLKGIIVNKLASNEDVVDLFNGLSTRSTWVVGDYFVDKFDAINKYCRTRWHKWRAKMVRNLVFNSVVGAFILLLLTVLQTILAVLPYVIKPRQQ